MLENHLAFTQKKKILLSQALEVTINQCINVNPFDFVLSVFYFLF